MSPPPLEKVVDVLRVHAPLTLSETRTCPVESNCPNQPTSRSPAFTAPVSGIVVCVVVVAVVIAPLCTAWIPDGLGVVTDIGADGVEWLPLPSNASTAYEYRVDGAAVPSVNCVALAPPVLPTA